MTRDTGIVLGSRNVDLTADERPEVVELAAGESLDSLDLMLTITSDGETIFSQRLRPLSTFLRSVPGGDAGPPSERQSRLEELTTFFLNDGRFRSPGEFVRWLESIGPRHIERIPRIILQERGEQEVPGSIAATAVWEDIKEREIVIFQFATGGDGITAIGWSAINERFYHLLQCC